MLAEKERKLSCLRLYSGDFPKKFKIQDLTPDFADFDPFAAFCSDVHNVYAQFHSSTDCQIMLINISFDDYDEFITQLSRFPVTETSI